MFTPTEQATPGSTPIMDPLQLQFLSGGQMQYMPQAQFMTPSSYGAFRTMPNPMVNGAPSESGIFHNWMVADRGTALLGLLPEYTINTFNPAISPVQQQTYAQRRLDDAWSTGMATLGSLGLATTLGGLAMVPGLGLAGLALGMFAPDIAKPVSERIRTTREIQDMSTAKIFSGDDLDTSLGYGFKASRARDLDRFMRAEAADDRIFDSGDYQEMLKLGMTYGQFDYTNSAADYKRILKNMRDIMSTMMQVMGSEDLKDIMENMKRMQSMGLTMEQYSAVARKEQAYSRMTGLSYNDMVETYGKSGALIFQQAGLNPMQGDIQSMANAANMTYLQRTGVLDPVITAKFGGISGLTQELTAQDAKVHRSIKDIILPAMMDDKLEHLRTDIDFNKALKNPTMLLQFMNESAGKIRTQEQWLSYNQHKDKAYAELTKNYDTEMLEMESAKQTGQMAGFKGRKAYEAGLVILGMGTEEAALKTNAYLSEEARATRRRAQEEGDIGKREELASKYSWMGKLERNLSKFFTWTGEKLFAHYTDNRFLDTHDVRTKAQKDFGGVARPGINQGSPYEKTEQEGEYTGNPLPPLTDLPPEEALKILNGSGAMTPEESRKYMLLLPSTLLRETGTVDPDKATANIDKSQRSVGAFQLTNKNAAAMFNSEFFKGTGFKEKYFKDINFKLVDIGEQGELNKWYEARKKAALDPKYVAAENSYVRYAVVKDRLDQLEKKYGSRMSKIRNNLPSMMITTSIANQGGVPQTLAVFDKLFDEKTGAFGTEEKLDALLKQEGGLGAAKAISQAAYDLVMESGATPFKTAGGERYNTNTDSKVSEYNNLRDIWYGQKGVFKETWNNILGASAIRMSMHAGFNTEYSHNTARVTANNLGKDPTVSAAVAKAAKAKADQYEADLGYSPRPDCSGLACGVLTDFNKVSGGTALPRELQGLLGKNGTDAATYYLAMRKINGGKDDFTYSLAGKSKEEAYKDLVEKLPTNSFVYLQDNNPNDTTNKGRDHANNIYHVAMIVKDPTTGEPILIDQRGEKADLQRVSLKQAIYGYDDPYKKDKNGNPLHIDPLIPLKNRTVRAISFGSIIKPSTYSIPKHSTPKASAYDNPEVLKKAIESNDKIRTDLLDSNLVRGGTVLEAYTWQNIHSRTKDFSQEELLRKISDQTGLNITGNELDQVLNMVYENNGKNTKSSEIAHQLYAAADDLGIDKDALENSLKNTLADMSWRDYVAVKPRENATDSAKEAYEKNNKIWRTLVAAQFYTSDSNFKNLSVEQRNKKIDDAMRDPNNKYNYQAVVQQKFSKDVGDIHSKFEEMGLNASRATSQVSSGARDTDYQKTASEVFAGTYGSIFGFTASDFDKKAWEHSPDIGLPKPGDTPNIILSRISFGTYADLFEKGEGKGIFNTQKSFNELASLSKVVDRTGKKEGEYYMQVPRLMALYNEYKYSDSKKRGYTSEQKKKIEDALLTAAKTFGIKDTSAFQKMLQEGNSLPAFMTKFLEMAGVSDVSKNTNAQIVLKDTADMLSPDRESDAYKFDLDAFLEKFDFTKFAPAGSKSNSVLITGDRVRDAYLSLQELLPGIDIRDFHKKDAVSDSQASQFYEMAGKRNLSEVAELMRKARETGTQVNMEAVYRALEGSGLPLGAPTGVNGGGAAGGYKVGQDGRPVDGFQIPSTGLNPPGEMGASGAIFQPETEVAFQRLPIVLERVEKTLADLNNTIGHGQVQPNIK